MIDRYSNICSICTSNSMNSYILANMILEEIINLDMVYDQFSLLLDGKLLMGLFIKTGNSCKLT